MKSNEEENERTLRIYDEDGDFTIKIPANARVTFGYFNPAASGKTAQNKYGGFHEGPGGSTMRTTSLRIYVKEGRIENQLACFMGVKGFRDSRIELTRITNKVVMEQTLVDDGEGNVEFGGKRMKQIVATTEPGSYQ